MSLKTPSKLAAAEFEDKRLKDFTPDSWYRRFGKKLHKNRFVYWLYGLFDAPPLILGLYKLFAQISAEGLKKNADNLLHEALENNIAFAFSLIFTAVATFVSAWGNYYEDDNKQLWKRSLAILWPYCRIYAKSLKNTYKGIGNFFKIVAYFGKNWAIHAFVAGLGLGILLGFNEWINRYLVQDRKARQDYNKKLLEALVLKQGNVDNKELKTYIPKKHSWPKRALAFFTAGFSGFANNFYYYSATFIIAAPLLVFPPVLVLLSLACCVFAAGNVLTRLNEERIFQGRLAVTALNVEIEVHQLLITNLLKELSTLESDSENQAVQCKQQLFKQMQFYLQKRDKRQAILRHSFLSSLLVGVKNGLTAYSTFSIIVFILPAFCTLLSVSLAPTVLPVLALATVGLGVGFLAVFSLHSIIKNRVHNYFEKQRQSKKLTAAHCASLKNESFAKQKHAIESEFANLVITPPPINLIYEKSEMGRSFFSANSKAWKLMSDLLFTRRKTKIGNADDYYYSDSKPVQILALGSGLVFGLVNFFRVFARGFGRSPAELDLIPVKLKETAVSQSTNVTIPEAIEAEHSVPTTENLKVQTIVVKTPCTGSSLDGSDFYIDPDDFDPAQKKSESSTSQTTEELAARANTPPYPTLKPLQSISDKSSLSTDSSSSCDAHYVTPTPSKRKHSTSGDVDSSEEQLPEIPIIDTKTNPFALQSSASSVEFDTPPVRLSSSCGDSEPTLYKKLFATTNFPGSSVLKRRRSSSDTHSELRSSGSSTDTDFNDNQNNFRLPTSIPVSIRAGSDPLSSSRPLGQFGLFGSYPGNEESIGANNDLQGILSS